LQRLVAEDASGKQDRSKHLWHILTLEYWYRSATAAGAGEVSERASEPSMPVELRR